MMSAMSRRTLIVVAVSILLGACGDDEPNAFDRAQYMPCIEWTELSQADRARQVGVLRDMQNPSKELLDEVEAQCTDDRNLAKALQEARLRTEGGK
jgi:hypothetical protein